MNRSPVRAKESTAALRTVRKYVLITLRLHGEANLIQLNRPSWKILC